MAEHKQIRCGGTSDLKEADHAIQKIVDNLKANIEEKTGKTYGKITAVNYRTQVVNGTNFFVKANTDGDEHIHLRIHKPLPVSANPEPQLSNVQTGKSAEDNIDYF